MTKARPTLVSDNGKAPAAPYQPTSAEGTVLHAQEARKAARLPMVRFRSGGADSKDVSFDHPDHETAFALLMESLGTADPHFAEGIVNQAANIGVRPSGKDPGAKDLNFTLSIVAGIEPRDQVETMLATQMAAVHLATVSMARHLSCSTTPAQFDQYEKAFNKLARTFTAQVEALKKYRSKGEQRVIVERVTVENGGQAIVGNVAHSKGGGAGA